ncbi:MAG: hypothetical protein U0Q55_22050 [Vicinamibacterales bacterium]
MDVQRGPIFPDAGIGRRGRIDRLLDEAPDQGEVPMRVVVHDSRVGQHRVQAQDYLAHQVVLALIGGRVPNANMPVPAVACQVLQAEFLEVAPAIDTVERLQRARLGDVHDEREEPLAFLQVTEAPKRLDHEGGVAQPAIPVVPRSRRAHRFRDTGCRGSDDRPGVVVRVQLQAERGPKYALRFEERERTGL